MAPRKRLGLPHSWGTVAGQKLMVVPALALIYGGAVVALLGAGFSPSDVDGITRYRTVYDELASLNPSAWSQATTVAIAVSGLVGLIVLVALGWSQRLIPHVTRSGVVLRDEEDGRTTVSPRAVERAVELAARHDGIRDAKATLGEDDLHLVLHASKPALIPDALRHAKASATTALERAGLPGAPGVRVTVTRFTPASRSELLK